MNIVITYWSRYGNGKKVVETLQQKLKAKKAKVALQTTEEADPHNMPEADIFIFSASAEAFRVQANMRKFMKQLPNMPDKKYGIINTHGMKNKNWLKSMEKILTKKQMKKIAEIDFRVGEGQEQGEGLEEGWKDKLDSFVSQLK